MFPLQAIHNLAVSQHGLVSAHQLAAFGLSEWTWRKLLSQGVLLSRGHGVASIVGAPESPEQQVLLAVLGTGVRCRASHASAAYLWGALHSIPPGPVDVIIDRSCTGYRERTDARVHRPVDWRDVGRAKRAHIPVTNPIRTLIDLGATEPALVRTAVEKMMIDGHVTREGLERGLARHARPGRAGTGPLRRVLANWHLGDTPPESVLEAKFARLLRDRGLPSAVFQYPLQGFRLDAAWPEVRVGAEVDGWTKYTANSQFHRQVERDALLLVAGWRIVHFTWTDVTRRPDYVVAVLRNLLKPLTSRSDTREGVTKI